jgi:hypothetical protein
MCPPARSDDHELTRVANARQLMAIRAWCRANPRAAAGHAAAASKAGNHHARRVLIEGLSTMERKCIAVIMHRMSFNRGCQRSLGGCRVHGRFRGQVPQHSVGGGGSPMWIARSGWMRPARHAMRGRLRSRPRQGLRSARHNRFSQADRSPLTRLFAPAVSTNGSRSA